MKKLETGLVRDDAQLIQSLTREVDSIVEESHADGYSFEYFMKFISKLGLCLGPLESEFERKEAIDLKKAVVVVLEESETISVVRENLLAIIKGWEKRLTNFDLPGTKTKDEKEALEHRKELLVRISRYCEILCSYQNALYRNNTEYQECSTHFHPIDVFHMGWNEDSHLDECGHPVNSLTAFIGFVRKIEKEKESDNFIDFFTEFTQKMIVGGECSSEMLHVLTTKSRSLVQSVLDEADKRGKVFLDDMFDLRNLFLRIGFDPEDQYGESSEECSDGLCGDEEVNIGERHMRAYEQQEEDYWLKD